MPRQEPPVQTEITLEQFLEFESTSPQKHEMVDGRVFMMAGGTRRHNRIAVRLGTLVEGALQDSSCLVAIADTLVLANNTPYYPDVMIYCEAEDDHRLVKKPCVLVEVLSKKTEDIDRGEKWLNYQTLESLQMYILLEQDTPRAEIFRRSENGWIYEKIETGSIRLSCVDLEVSLANIYTRLD